MQNGNSAFKMDRSNTVTNRNRYGNVQPWDGSRIKLAHPIHGSDYINASPIKLRTLNHPRGRPGGSPDTFVGTRYIATQGPKSDQTSHFWHMVMQQTSGPVGAIIMLTQCYEGLKEKCAQYFPLDHSSPTIHIPPEPKQKQDPPAPLADDGDPFLDPLPRDADTDSSPGSTPDPSLSSNRTPPTPPSPTPETHTLPGTVTLLNLTHDATIGCEVRTLGLTFGNTTKTIYHYFYGNWADFGKPEAEDRLALLQLMRVSKQVAAGSPRIVHCSAGVGRTGTWIALDFLLHELEEGRIAESYFDTSTITRPAPETRGNGNGKPEKSTWGKSGPAKVTTPEPKESDIIHDTVDRLRLQRMMMVMNEIQYTFLYEALRERFIEIYAERESGPRITSEASISGPLGRESGPLGGGVEERSPKVARTESMEMQEGSVGREQSEEVSEAETEIAEKAGGERDPYRAVAPEHIRKGVEKQEG